MLLVRHDVTSKSFGMSGSGGKKKRDVARTASQIFHKICLPIVCMDTHSGYVPLRL